MNKLNHLKAEPSQAAKTAGYRTEQLAELCGCSQRHLRRFFHKYFECTAKQWLDEIRFAQAKWLMQSGEQVKNVAKQSGFSETSNFRRWFKAKSGQTPHKFLLNQH